MEKLRLISFVLLVITLQAKASQAETGTRTRTSSSADTGAGVSSYDLSFLVVGDWGGDLTDSDQTDAQNAVAKAMASQGKNLNPPVSFILAPGDNLYPSGLTGKEPDDANRIITSFTNVYNDPVFNHRWYLNLGNHDYDGVVDAQLNRSSVDARWYQPARYYKSSFSVGNGTADLFVLDTNPAGMYAGNASESDQMTKELASQDFTIQMEWFQAQLAQSTADWCLVMGHHTIYNSKASHCYEELQTTVSPLLEQYGCIYIGGHKHDLEHNHYNGVDYFTSGAGSQQPLSLKEVSLGKSEPWTIFKDAVAGYMTVQMNSNTFLVSMYDTDNQLLYSNATKLYRSKNGSRRPY